MTIFDYIGWVRSSRLEIDKRLTLPPVQRSALWRPRQVLDLWRSIFDGMPIGSLYLSNPGTHSRVVAADGTSETVTTSQKGFNLLDGQQRTLAMMLAIDPPQCTGKCVWVEVLNDEIELHLTTRRHPFGFDKDGGRLNTDALRNAHSKLTAEMPAHEIFDATIKETRGTPRLPARCAEGSTTIWPLNEIVARWPSSTGLSAGQSLKYAKAEFRNTFGKRIYDAITNIAAGEIAFIRVITPKDDAGGRWLLSLFDRIGTGGTALSGPERLFSMYKHRVPTVHDAVEEITKCSPGLLESVEIARTAIRIAGTKKPKPVFWDPAPLEFCNETSKDRPLRIELEKLITPGQRGGETALGKAFATIDRLIRYRPDPPHEEWDIGLPVVFVGDLHPELVRVLVHWAVLSNETDVEGARGDLIRFALFWHLCVTNDGKAAAQASQILCDWKADGSFPWNELYRRLTGVDAPIIGDDAAADDYAIPIDPSALRLVPPCTLSEWAKHERPSATLRTWQERFERPGDPNTVQLFGRWWGRHGMLLWLQRGYLEEVLPSYRPETAHEDDRPVDLDHIQPKATFNDWTRQRGQLPSSDSIKKAFRDQRWTLGHSIGNVRWVPPDVNRQDGDRSICEKLRLDQNDWKDRIERRPSARDGAMDSTSKDLWKQASSGSDSSWTEDRISAWQQAVEERALWTYEQFWIEAGFSVWYPTRVAL